MAVVKAKAIKASAAKRSTTSRSSGNRGAIGGNKKKQLEPQSVKKSVSNSGAKTKDLLQAGLNALSLPRAESAMADGLSKIVDSMGFRKLEDVFDQRVASALERLGFPSVGDLCRLVALADTLEAEKNEKEKKPISSPKSKSSSMKNKS